MYITKYGNPIFDKYIGNITNDERNQSPKLWRVKNFKISKFEDILCAISRERVFIDAFSYNT